MACGRARCSRSSTGRGSRCASIRSKPPAHRRPLKRRIPAFLRWRNVMDESEYWREQAIKYKERARVVADPELQDELLELGAVCENLAETIEDRAPGG